VKAVGSQKFSMRMIAIPLCALLFALDGSANAQQPVRDVRIGYLDNGTVASNVELLEALRKRLSELGWTEGKNLTFEYRFGEGKGPGRLAELAADLVRLNADLIVVTSTSSALAVKQATRSIPIVMAGAADPVGQGIIASLARPGGNITGLANLAEDLGGKRLEILKEAIPRASLVAVFMGSERGRGVELQAKLMKTAAPALGLKLEMFGVTGEPQRLENAFQTVARNGFHALITTSGAFMFAERKRIAILAVKYRLPGIYPQKEFVEEGGLLSYGIDRPSQYRQAATYVDKILKGVKPADLPVEQPKKFEFVINLKAAKQIGLIIPPNVLARADKVIR